ncbi:MAG: GTP-binding protein, partial [Bauldia sp.]|nr:GTP-binding protein [Bauldia sp.]
QTFFMDDEVRAKAKLDAVVTVADAKHLIARLDDAPEAEEQIGFADVVILNKTDLVTPEELAEVERRIRAINEHAVIHRTERCALPLDRVLDRGAFDLDRILTLDPEFLEGEDHDHDHDHHDHDGHDHDHHDHDHHHHHAAHDPLVTSLSLRAGDLDPQRFFPWIEQITQGFGPDILRLKGILALKDDPERYVVQGVHMIIEGNHQRPWREDEKHESRLVFIGRRLDADLIKAGFAACAVTPA